MPRVNRLVELDIGETSGVDHPAHLHDGWLVIKNQAGVRDVLDRARQTQEEPMPDGIDLDSISDDATRKAVEALIAKAGDADDAADTEALQKAIDEAINKARNDWEAALASLDDDDGGDDDVTKGLPENVRKMIEDRDEEVAKAKSEAAEAIAIAKAEEFRRVESEAIAKARESYPHVAGARDGSLGKALLRLHLSDPEAAEAVEKSLAAANGQLDSADIFKQLGSSFDDDGESPEAKLDALAKARSDEKDEDFAVAYGHVLKTDEGRKLYAATRKG